MPTSDDEEVLEITSEEEQKENFIYNDPDTICSICHAEFLDPEDLQIHLYQVHMNKSSTLKYCHFCSETFTDLMEYAEHLRDAHVSSLTTCTYCWRVFNDFDEHRTHQRKHIKNKHKSTYSCSQCSQLFVDLALMKKHEYEQHFDAEGAMLYEVLPYLSAALKVKSITFIEALNSDVVYICVGCAFSTVDIFTYLRHAKSDECKIFVCNGCSNVFNKKKYLAKHLRSNCYMFGKRISRSKMCPECNTSIPAGMFAKHRLRCKPIRCFICDISFENMNEWSEHQSKEHAGRAVEVEICEYCAKRCVGKVAMRRHIDKIHKPEFHLYKYICVYCKNIFKHPQKLFTHFFTQHKDISPYTCRICDKTFKLRKKFTIHIKLDHKSVGFVEFDENYHVFFSDKKSENPFIPKSHYVNETQSKSNSNPVNSGNNDFDSSFLNATETEGNQTEIEVIEKPMLKRKRTLKGRKNDTRTSVSIESSDENEPLMSVRKKVRLQKKIGTKIQERRTRSSKSLLTCKVCNKYCYTFQNYNHHISLHSKHDIKKCIKCSEVFKSTAKLNKHIATEHSSSKLTETLKTLLEKRKTGGSLTEDLPASEKFRRTIKKAKLDTNVSSAEITVVDQKLSVQKFLENFVPEEIKTDDPINSTASIKIVTGQLKEPAIKMTKFKPNPISNSLKLAMPVKFIDRYPEKAKVSIKIVNTPDYIENNYQLEYDDDTADMDTHESIPDVAEEVMLEGTDDERRFDIKKINDSLKFKQDDDQKPNQKDIINKLAMQKLPIGMKDIRIAHLLPQAPFYKIVKVKEVLDQKILQKKLRNPESNAPSSIKLADGTKLVTTNPLAHLLGNNHESVLEKFKSRYYKVKNKNFQGMLAEALQTLDKPTFRGKRKKDVITENE